MGAGPAGIAPASGPVKAIRCPCGFEVRSTRESELIEMARLHVERTHDQRITEEQARALIQVI